MGITFNPEITLGHLIEATSALMVIASVIITVRSDVKTLKSDVSSVKAEVKKLVEVMVTLGRQDERLTAMERRLDGMSPERSVIHGSKAKVLG